MEAESGEEPPLVVNHKVSIFIAILNLEVLYKRLNMWKSHKKYAINNNFKYIL